jgi:hypothetical protein
MAFGLRWRWYGFISLYQGSRNSRGPLSPWITGSSPSQQGAASTRTLWVGGVPAVQEWA